MFSNLLRVRKDSFFAHRFLKLLEEAKKESLKSLFSVIFQLLRALFFDAWQRLAHLEPTFWVWIHQTRRPIWPDCAKLPFFSPCWKTRRWGDYCLSTGFAKAAKPLFPRFWPKYTPGGRSWWFAQPYRCRSRCIRNSRLGCPAWPSATPKPPHPSFSRLEVCHIILGHKVVKYFYFIIVLMLI